MSDVHKAFMTGYLGSLLERSRSEKSGTKWGIDWVVYNLGLVRYGKPIRLPFLRRTDDDVAKSKTEAEFGVDLAFLSDDRNELVIFVLKKDPLTNKTWVKKNFDEDLRKAVCPDLGLEGLEEVRSVRIILVYNNDDDQAGVRLYNNFVAGVPKEIRKGVGLDHDRWNLSELVEQIFRHLLTPALLPQSFFGQLNYLCAQFAEIRHGSEPWVAQLVPGWQRFVEDVLTQGSRERGVALLPIALIILREHGSENKSFETGWLELVEIAALALWRKSLASDDARLQARVNDFWNGFYIQELFRFYSTHIEALATENSLDQIAGYSYVGSVAAGAVAHWHLGRIGVLSYSLRARHGSEEVGETQAQQEALNEISTWTVRILNANHAGYRPLLDIHHIEWFLTTFTLICAGRRHEIKPLFQRLIERLHLRRMERSELPFLDGSNSLDNVFEHVATRGEDSQLVLDSSAFVLMLMELSFLMADVERDEMLALIHSRLVIGFEGSGEGPKSKPLHLLSWSPPTNWAVAVLNGFANGGITTVSGPFTNDRDGEAGIIQTSLQSLVVQMRATGISPDPQPVPIAALILASIRHRSPIPAELWRQHAFPMKQPESVEV